MFSFLIIDAFLALNAVCSYTFSETATPVGVVKPCEISAFGSIEKLCALPPNFLLRFGGLDGGVSLIVPSEFYSAKHMPLHAPDTDGKLIGLPVSLYLDPLTMRPFEGPEKQEDTINGAIVSLFSSRRTPRLLAPGDSIRHATQGNYSSSRALGAINLDPSDLDHGADDGARDSLRKNSRSPTEKASTQTSRSASAAFVDEAFNCPPATTAWPVATCVGLFRQKGPLWIQVEIPAALSSHWPLIKNNIQIWLASLEERSNLLQAGDNWTVSGGHVFNDRGYRPLASADRTDLDIAPTHFATSEFASYSDDFASRRHRAADASGGKLRHPIRSAGQVFSAIADFRIMDAPPPPIRPTETIRKFGGKPLTIPLRFANKSYGADTRFSALNLRSSSESAAETRLALNLFTFLPARDAAENAQGSVILFESATDYLQNPLALFVKNTKGRPVFPLELGPTNLRDQGYQPWAYFNDGQTALICSTEESSDRDCGLLFRYGANGWVYALLPKNKMTQWKKAESNLVWWLGIMEARTASDRAYVDRKSKKGWEVSVNSSNG